MISITTRHHVAYTHQLPMLQNMVLPKLLSSIEPIANSSITFSLAMLVTLSP